MITVLVLDRTAEQRNRLVRMFEASFRQVGQLNGGALSQHLLPQLDIRPISLQEFKFFKEPEICVVGSGVTSKTSHELRVIRKAFPTAVIIAESANSDLTSLEKFILLGANDIFHEGLSAEDLVRKLLVFSSRDKPPRRGTLITFDSGKGGVGVTTLVASLGDIIAETGKRVALLDLDYETQDLSRFLQAAPYFNEQLELLFMKSRPPVGEHVSQCLVQVWSDSSLYCMPPTSSYERLYQKNPPELQTFLTLLEGIDASHDVVLVDTGGMCGDVVRRLYRLSNKVVFVVSTDPTSIHSAVHRLSKMCVNEGERSDVHLLVVGAMSGGMSYARIKEACRSCVPIEGLEFLRTFIPFCPDGSRWAGSRYTLVDFARRSVRRALFNVTAELGFEVEYSQQKSARPAR